MISQYGEGLSNPEAQFSGALARQRDYADTLESYHLIVPAATDSEETIDAGGGLVIHPVKATGAVAFVRAAARRAAALHSEHHYDAFMVDNPHLGGLLGVYLKRTRQIPFVLHTMADMIRNPWYRKERLSNHLKSLMMEVAARSADLIRVSTKAELERLKDTPFASKLHKVSFYVDQEQIKTKLQSVVAPAHTTKTELLFVGRLGHQKDLPVLLAAMKQVVAAHPDVRLTIVGGGPLEAELKAQAKSFGIASQVIFTGPVPYEAVIEHFKAADAFVIASLYEGTCMVLHEAGLAGVPVVATDFAGARDLVEDGQTGYLVPIRDTDALAESILRIVRDQAGAAQMGVALKTAVEGVDREFALTEWNGLCQKITALSTTRAV